MELKCVEQIDMHETCPDRDGVLISFNVRCLRDRIGRFVM